MMAASLHTPSGTLFWPRVSENRKKPLGQPGMAWPEGGAQRSGHSKLGLVAPSKNTKRWVAIIQDGTQHGLPH